MSKVEKSKPIAPKTNQNEELKQQMQQLEREREFYFEKLREIEVYCQKLVDNGETSQIVKDVQQIMYKVEDGFEQPE